MHNRCEGVWARHKHQAWGTADAGLIPQVASLGDQLDRISTAEALWHKARLRLSLPSGTHQDGRQQVYLLD